MTQAHGEKLMVEIAAPALQRLMAEGKLAAADFRCCRRQDRAQIKRWCLEHACRQSRHPTAPG